MPPNVEHSKVVQNLGKLGGISKGVHPVCYPWTIPKQLFNFVMPVQIIADDTFTQHQIRIDDIVPGAAYVKTALLAKLLQFRKAFRMPPQELSQDQDAFDLKGVIRIFSRQREMIQQIILLNISIGDICQKCASTPNGGISSETH